MTFSLSTAPHVSLRYSRPRSAPRSSHRLVCRAQDEHQPQILRRNALAAGGLMLAGGLLSSPAPSQANIQIKLAKENLSTAQINELRGAMKTRAEKILSETVDAGDCRDGLRLVINDAGTYDVTTGSGGLDGSIIFPEELNRPENVGLKPYVAKLEKAKAQIDEDSSKNGQGPISWADVIVLGAKVATQLSWFDYKLKVTGDATSAAALSKAFGVAFPVTIGRIDATGPSPAANVPPPDAPAAEAVEFMRRLANKSPDTDPGYFSAKPPFGPRAAFVLYPASCSDPLKTEEEWVASDPEKFERLKKSYDKSRRTVTRTDYEVDFVDVFTKITSLGVKYDKLAYLKDLELDVKA